GRPETDAGSSKAPAYKRGHYIVPEPIHVDEPPIWEARPAPTQMQTQPIEPEVIRQRATYRSSIQQAIDGESDKEIGETRRTTGPVKKPAARRAKRGVPRPPRPIRMMIGRPG